MTEDAEPERPIIYFFLVVLAFKKIDSAYGDKNSSTWFLLTASEVYLVPFFALSKWK